jgi:hypothetical protein
MNESQYKYQIQRFLRGQDKRDLDAFHIYQWIERCHIQGWWKMALGLSSSVPPGSLTPEYQKRLEVLLKECRIKQEDPNEVRSNGPIPQRPGTDRRPIRKVISLQGPPRPKPPIDGPLFDNNSKMALLYIYSVLHYLEKKYSFVDSAHKTKDKFEITYQTVDDACARRFAGTVEIFQRWYRGGEILQRLKSHFHLSRHDCQIFDELLTSKSKRDL